MVRSTNSTLHSVWSVAALILVIASLTTGCQSTTPVAPNKNITERLNAAKETWASLDIHTYSFSFRWRCYCDLELQAWKTLNVENDTLVSITESLTGRVFEEQNLSAYVTVPQLFEFVQRTRNRNLDVRFDKDTGVPYDVFANTLDRGFEVRNLVIR